MFNALLPAVRSKTRYLTISLALSINASRKTARHEAQNLTFAVDKWNITATVVKADDANHHLMDVKYQHESLEDSVRIEFKFYPDGNAIESWNRLVGGSLAE